MLPLPARSALPLSRYPAIYTTDFDEAALMYSRLVTPVRLNRTLRRTPFSWRGNRVAVGSLGVSSGEYAGGVSAESEGPATGYVLSIPLSEARGEGSFGAGFFPMIRGRSALFSSPGERAKVVLQPGYQGLELSFSSTTLADAMVTLTGAAPRELRFQRSLALDSPQVGPFLRLLRELVMSAEIEPAPFGSAPFAARLAEALLFRLLLSQPHSQLAVLAAPGHAAEPRYVRRAADYLAAHVARPITMAELTREAGVSARSLQLGFQKYRDCSPLDFLLARRLERARVLLLTSDAVANVSQAARLAGFQHMGRFSLQYRARFGETPTGTLAKGWGRSGRVAASRARLEEAHGPWPQPG